MILLELAQQIAPEWEDYESFTVELVLEPFT
jgi:hypothetical protein